MTSIKVERLRDKEYYGFSRYIRINNDNNNITTIIIIPYILCTRSNIIIITLRWKYGHACHPWSSRFEVEELLAETSAFVDGEDVGYDLATKATLNCDQNTSYIMKTGCVKSGETKIINDGEYIYFNIFSVISYYITITKNLLITYFKHWALVRHDQIMGQKLFLIFSCLGNCVSSKIIVFVIVYVRRL